MLGFWATTATGVSWALPMPSFAAVGRFFAPAAPTGYGSSNGRTHMVAGDATKATSGGNGHKAGSAPGQLPAYKPSTDAHVVTNSGNTSVGRRGFDTATSVFDGKKSTANTDVYDNTDGSLSIKDFQVPVNFRKSDGTWAPVDTTLSRSSSSGRLTEATAGVSAPSFASSAADPNLLTYTFAAGESVSFGLAGAAPVAPAVSGSTAVYSGVLPGVDLKLEALAYGVKESIVLDSASAPRSFTYTMHLTGLTAQIAPDGSLALFDSSGTQVGEVPAGQMTAANVAFASQEAPTSHGVTYALATVGGAPAMTVSLDSEWLDDPARVYPVTVDPTVQVNSSVSTYALNQGPNNNSSDLLIKVGTCNNTTGCGGDYASAGFVSFPNIASTYQNDYVTGAQLNLDQVWDEECSTSDVLLTSSEKTYSVAPITASWSATALMAFGSSDNGTNEPKYGNSIGTGQATSSNACNGNGQWESVNLSTGPFNAWTGGTSATAFYGFALYAANTDTTYKKFASDNTANQPYLLLTVVSDTPPSVAGEQPPSGQQLMTLQPELTVNGTDSVDNFPGKPFQYEFQVYNDASGTPVMVSDSGTLSTGEWVVPAGVLTWSGDYYWQARMSDQVAWSPWSLPSSLGLSVQQPPITSHLGGVNSGPGYDGLTGNYTTQATDANVAAVGPALTVQRTYNSSDPRVGQAFGAGWSSVVDSSAQLATDGSNDLLITYANGQETRFGNNGNGTFSAPSGMFATITPASTTPASGSSCPATSVGYCLLDKTGTTYAFTMPQSTSGGTGGPWLVSSVADPQGRATLFSYTAVSGVAELASMESCVSACQGTSPVLSRSLSFVWSSAAVLGHGASYAHVTQVATNPVSGTASTADLVWTYSYSGDQLAGVCDPTEQAGGCAQETTYSYQPGSQFSAGALDSAPESYWRLNDAVGSSAAADQELANENQDSAQATNVTFGVASTTAGPDALVDDPAHGLAYGPLGAGATVASFNGTSSGLTLPPDLVQGKDYLSFGLWFQTSETGVAQMLVSTGHSDLGTVSPSNNAAPVLYIGTDGKLYGHFYNGNVTGIVSPGTVTDGKWHYVVLSAAGSTQTMYLDGQSDGSQSGALTNIDPDDFIGAGVFNSEFSWTAGGPGGAWSYFDGQISDVAYYPGSVGATTVGDLYQAAKAPSALLTNVTKPSGATQAQVTYDTANDRVKSVTDQDGGTYQVPAPTVSGSSGVYAGSVLGASPGGYWRLGEPSGGVANNQVTAHTVTVSQPSSCSGGTCTAALTSSTDPQGDGVYNNVTLGASGSSAFSDSTGAQFNGTSSYVQLPNGTLPASGGYSVGLWFNTTSNNGVLLGLSGNSVTSSSANGYDPLMYVGADGKLNAGLWSTSPFTTLTSPAAVTDGNWYYAVLTSDGVSQSLYLNGQLVASKSGAVSPSGFISGGLGTASVNVGAGWNGGSWPDEADSVDGNNGAVMYFNGDISDVAVYDNSVANSQVTQQYADLKSSAGLTPVVSVTVTDPLSHPLTTTYDPTQGGRVLTTTNANGGTTQYGYDSGGFLYTVTDPLGDVTTSGHDVRGNVVSQTTCQDLAENECSTSYNTYWPDDSSSALTPDPRDDVKVSSRDARSASASDPSFMTTYAYDQYGNALTSIDPLGRTSTSTYSNGTQAAITAPTSTANAAACTAATSTTGTIPSGLLLTARTAGGAVTTDQYYANGDLAVQTSPLGEKTIYVYDGVGRVLFKTQCYTTYPSTATSSYSAYTYDGDGRTLTETAPAVVDELNSSATHQQRTTNVYTSDGQIQSTTASDVGGSSTPDTARVTSYTYYPSGLTKTQTDPTSAETDFTYDAEGNKTGETDKANGNVWAYTYDGDGHQTSTVLTGYVGGSQGVCQPVSSQLVTDSKAYDLDGRLASETDAMCRQTSYTYYDNGLSASVTKDAPAGSGSPNITETKTYDAAGDMVTDTTGNGEAETLATYDAAKQPTLTRVLYCANSNQCANYAGTPLYKNTQTSYSLDGKASSVSTWQDDGSGTVDTTDYTYDAAGDKLTSSVHQSTQAQVDAAANLNGQWNLADGNSTTAQDGSGRNNTEALTGGEVWSLNAPTGMSGSVQLDGTSGYASTAGPVVGTAGSFSISAWVDLASTTQDYQEFAYQNSVADPVAGLEYSPTFGGFSFIMLKADGHTSDGLSDYDYASTHTGVAVNTWVHLVGTYNSTSGAMTLYVNGQSAATATDSTPFAASGAFTIGAGKNSACPAGCGFTDGEIANVQTYSRTLSADEAAQLDNNQSLGNQGLSGSWLLSDGAKTVAADSSAGSHLATTAGGVSWTSANGGAVQLDGSSGYLSTAGPVVGTAGSFSISAWVDLASTVQDYQEFAYQSSVGDPVAGLEYSPTFGGFSFIMLKADGHTSDGLSDYDYASTHTGVAVNTWVHLVGTYNATSHAMTLYVNGQSAATATDSTPFATTGAFTIGAGKNSACPTGCGFTNGKITKVQTYSQALTTAQIATLYAGGSLVTAPTVATTSWTYDQRGVTTSMTEPLGNVSGATAGSYTTTYTSDPLGRVYETQAPAVVTYLNGYASGSAVTPTTWIGYDTFGDQAETENANGKITAASYDGDGRPLKETLPTYTQPGTGTYTATLIATKENDYNPDGTVKDKIDPAGNETTFTYDQLGDTTQQNTPAINVTSGTTTSSQAGQATSLFDQDGELLQTTDPTGAVTQYAYNYLGQTVSQTVPVRQSALATESTTSTYDALGNVLSTQLPGESAQTSTFDAAGELTSSTDSAGHKTIYSYDLAGHPVKILNPDTSYTMYTYNLNGQQIQSADYTSSGTQLRSSGEGYDLNGNKLWSGDYLGNNTLFGYNADNQLIWQQEASSTLNITTSYGYDAAGNRTLDTDANGNSTYATYNSWDLPESTVVPSSGSYTAPANRATTFVYDVNGNPVQELSPGGIAVTNNYDALGDLTSQTGSGAIAPTDIRNFGYDQDGNITATSTVSSGGTTDTAENFTYDDLGDLLTSSGTAGSASFTYNQNGQMLTRSDAAGQSTYTYNTAGQLATNKDPLTGTTAGYTYNNRGQLSTISYGTGDVQSFGYDTLDRLNTDTLNTAATGGTRVAEIDYTYNKDDEETNQNTYGIGTASPTTSVNNTYTYDQGGRLTSWNNGTTTNSYAYDQDGNRTCITTAVAGCTAANTTYTYNALDQLTSDGTNTYTYQPNGTLSTKTPIATGTPQVSEFDAYQQMAVQGSNAFTQDGLGRVVTAGSATLKYSGTDNNEVSDGSAVYALDPNGTIVADQAGTAGTRLTMTDQHDNLVASFGPSATSLTGWQTYDPLGNVASSSTWTAAVGYQSGYTTNGQVDMNSRWYSTTSGQFDSADTAHNNPNPQAVNANPYAYANDNPLTGIDPTGHLSGPTGALCGSALVDQEIPGVGEASDAGCGASLIYQGIATLLALFVANWVMVPPGSAPNPQPNAAPTPFGKSSNTTATAPASLTPAALATFFDLFGLPFNMAEIAQLIAELATRGSSSTHTGVGGKGGAESVVYVPPPPPPPPWEVKRSPGASTCTTAGCVGDAQASAGPDVTPYIPLTAPSTAAEMPAGFYRDGDGNLVNLATGEKFCGSGTGGTSSSACIPWPGSPDDFAGWNSDDDTLLSSGGLRSGAPRLLMSMTTVRQIAAKYELDIRGIKFNLNKGVRGKAYGSTAPNKLISLYSAAFSNEEQLARTLAHELFHVQQINSGMGYPDSYDSENEWEAQAVEYENQWWEQQKHKLSGGG